MKRDAAKHEIQLHGFLLYIDVFCCVLCAFVPFRSKVAVLTDQRIKVMNEIISGMRVIKMYTWEKPFAKLVADVRRFAPKKLKMHYVVTCK